MKRPMTNANRRMLLLAGHGHYSIGPGGWTPCNVYQLIREHLGGDWPDQQMPPELSGSFKVAGIKIQVLSSKEKTSLTRIKVTCPDCNKVVSSGRVGQHRCPK